MDYTNKDEVLEKVKRSFVALKKATLFQDDYEVVSVAVEHCGLAIEYASDRLKKDRELVKKAVSNFGKAILCVPEYLNDIEMVTTAYDNDESIIKYVQENQAIMNQMYLYINSKERER